MGGVAGHLNHLYDDRSMSFNKMMDIIDTASAGNLSVEEKVDGQNLFISWSNERGEALAARNKGNIKQKGMTAAELSNKFAGRGPIQKVYDEAFDTFATAVEKLPPETREAIFGSDADIWYNVEVMSPENPNVLIYDNNYLKIHSGGHKLRDKETGAPVNYDASENVAVLDKNIQALQKAAAGKKYKIVRNATLKLQALSSDKAATEAKQKITDAIRQMNLSEDASVGEYLSARLKAMIKSQTTELDDEKVAQIVARLLKLEGAPNLTQIKKGLSSEQKEIVSKLANKVTEKMMMADAIRPIEEANHDFAVEMLKGLESLFVLSPKEEVKRLQDVVSKSVTEMEQMATDGEISAEDMDFLRVQLNKIKGLDKISTSIEGVVFQIDGNLYKFTGNFAPINQIVGMLKYGRIKKTVKQESMLHKFDSILSEAMQTVNEENGKKIALVPGAFKPPHAGHYLGAKHLAEIEDVEKVIVLISPSPRDGITVEQSKKIWETYLANDPDKKATAKMTLMVPSGSPVRQVYDMVADKEMFKPGDSVIFGQGEKESGGAAERMASFAERNNPGVNVEYVKTPMFASGITGTQMRELVKNNNEKEFKKHLPNFIKKNDDLADQVWSIATQVSEANIVDQVIDEMTTAGAISGAPLGISTSSSKKKRKKKSYTVKRR